MTLPTTLVTTGDLRFFRIDQATGQLYVTKKLSYEAEAPATYTGKKPAVDGEYKIWVRATDPSGESDDQEVTITATQANDAPKINGSWTVAQIQDNNNVGTDDDVDVPSAPSELRVNEKDDDNNTPGNPDGADDLYTGAPQMTVPGVLGNDNVFTASDEDARGQIIWDLEGEDAGVFTLTNTSADPTTGLKGPDEPVTLRFKSAPDYEDPKDANKDSVYKVTLVASDGSLSDKRPLTIFVNNVNEKGKVDLTDDQPLTDDPVTAEVVDPDNGVAVITWQWTKATSTANFSATLNTIAATETVIHGATSDTYTPRGKSSSYAGDEGYYLMVRATYTDTTSRSDDPNTTDIDERTQKRVNENTVAQIPNTDGNPPAGSVDRTYRVAAISKNAVGVNPKTSETLKFSADSYDRTVAENSEVGSVVGDPVRIDENDITYSLSDTTSGDDDYFTIDANTGQIRVGKVDFPSPIPTGSNCDADTNTTNIATCPSEADPSLDYETKKIYALTISATDSAKPSRGKATATVNVTLDDLNESPYFDKVSRDRAANAITYVETRTNAVMQLAVTEPDGSGLEWEVVGTDAADFTLTDADSIPGEDKKRKNLEFKSQPNFEKPTDRAHNADGIPGISTDTGAADDAAENGTYKVTVRVTETAPAAGPRKSAELDVTVTLGNSKEKGSAYLTLLQPEVGHPDRVRSNGPGRDHV